MNNSHCNQFVAVKQALFYGERVIYFAGNPEASKEAESQKPDSKEKPTLSPGVPIDDIYGENPEQNDTGKNLESYLKELEDKFQGTPEALEQMKKDLEEAENADLHDLQGALDRVKMGRLFLDKSAKAESPLEFTVNFQKDSKRFQEFNRYVGAAHILPPNVTEIAVTDSEGKTQIGTRKIVDGRLGFFDETGDYIQVYDGYNIAIRKAVPDESAKDQKDEEKKNHDDMSGTVWAKDEDAPIDLNVSVEDLKNRGDDKHAKKTSMVFEGIGQVYVNAPDNLEEYVDDKGVPVKPQYIVYYHGNGGQEGNKGTVDEQVRRLRAKGIPAVLVYMRDDSGRGWKKYDQPKAFSSVMKKVEEQTGVKVDHNVRLAAFSGGGYGLGKALEETKGTNLGEHITDVTYLDAIYGDENRDAIAEFAADPDKKVNIIYTSHLDAANREVEQKIRERRGLGEDEPLEGVNSKKFRRSHGEAVGEFENLLS